MAPRRPRRVVAGRLLARGVGALRGALDGDGDFDRRRAGLCFGDFERVGGIDYELQCTETRQTDRQRNAPR